MVITDTIDALMWLQGDEDGGVGINCRVCDRGGLPIAYYTWPDDPAYRNTDVQIVASITALIDAGQRHAVAHSG